MQVAEEDWVILHQEQAELVVVARVLTISQEMVEVVTPILAVEAEEGTPKAELVLALVVQEL